MIFEIGVSIVVLFILAVMSVLFNSYIDGRSENDGYDGETSVLVAIGVSYTIVIGIGGLAAVWGSWQMAQYGIMASFAAFVASGIPMMLGDANRTKRRRKGEGS